MEANVKGQLRNELNGIWQPILQHCLNGKRSSITEVGQDVRPAGNGGKAANKATA